MKFSFEINADVNWQIIKEQFNRTYTGSCSTVSTPQLENRKENEVEKYGKQLPCWEKRRMPLVSGSQLGSQGQCILA
jgi:hypothetical protein